MHRSNNHWFRLGGSINVVFVSVLIILQLRQATAQTCSWSPVGTGMTGSTFTQVDALAAYNGNLIAGGNFDKAGGVTAQSIAQWNGTSWSPLGNGVQYWVYAFTTYNSNLIVGGAFSTAGGITASNIAQWNGTSWSALGSGSDAAVDALAVYNGNLIAGRQGTMFVNAITQWNGTSWSPLGPGIYGIVRALYALQRQIDRRRIISDDQWRHCQPHSTVGRELMVAARKRIGRCCREHPSVRTDCLQRESYRVR